MWWEMISGGEFLETEASRFEQPEQGLALRNVDYIVLRQESQYIAGTQDPRMRRENLHNDD